GFDGFADRGGLVGGQIVHHDNVAVPQDRNHELLDIGAKALPIHRSVEHTGCRDPTDAERGTEGWGLPVSPRYSRHQTLTTRTAAIAARHVGRRTGFIDEEQAFRR